MTVKFQAVSWTIVRTKTDMPSENHYAIDHETGPALGIEMFTLCGRDIPENARLKVGFGGWCNACVRAKRKLLEHEYRKHRGS